MKSHLELFCTFASNFYKTKYLMARSQETFGKKEKEKKRKKKREEKLKKKAERKDNSNKGGDLESMMAYVDEFGNISDTPPDPTVKRVEVDAESIELGVPKREEIVMDAVRKGKVEFFNDQKGFGFIKEDETQEKFFVHVHGCTEEIRENDKVSFELEQGLKGLNCVRVKKI